MKTKPPTPRSGLLAGGSWSADTVKQLDAFPHPGCNTPIREQVCHPGGAARNMLLTLARLGAPFPLYGAGSVGKDPAGQALLDECHQAKIDTHYLRATGAYATASRDLLVERKSGCCMTLQHGAAAGAWQGEDLDFTRIKARHFHLGSLLALDGMDAEDKKYGTRAAALLAKAQAAGLKTSFDLIFEDSERFSRIIATALKYTDYCLLDEIEAGKIAGFKTRQSNGQLETVALRHAAGALLQMGTRELVFIHFPEGSFARTRKGEDVWKPSLKLPATAIVNRSVAGDVFNAGALLGIHEGWELARCLEAGVCAAAVAILDPAGPAAIKSLNATLALANKYRFRPALEPED